MTTVEITEDERLEDLKLEWRPGWRARFGWSGWLGVGILVCIALLGVFAPLIAPYGADTQLAVPNLMGSSGAHLLGTDEASRDVFSRVLFGIRTDLLIVFVAAPLGAIIGCAIGLVATRSVVGDTIAQRSFDVIFAFPALILAITLTAILGTGVVTVCLVIIVGEIPLFGRLMRTAVKRIEALPFVEAAVVVGAGRWWILRRHVLPNALEPILVQLAISMSVAVFIEGAMSYLGIGVRPPTPSLGSLINAGMRNIYVTQAAVVGPVVAVILLVLGFSLVAQGLIRVNRGG